MGILSQFSTDKIKFGAVDDVLNLMQLFGILMYFLSPFIIILITIYLVRMGLKKKHNKSKSLGSERELMKRLQDIKEPIHYNSLALEFDINGKIIQK